MNEYFQTLKDINQSIEQLLAHEYNFVKSVEIQESANNLKTSIKPCLDELKSSAIRLEKLIKICLENLDHAEDVWESKQRIAKASKAEIWEQLSDFTGCHFKIQELEAQYKESSIKKAEDLLQTSIEKIKQYHFIDHKTKQHRLGIGWGDKDSFNKTIFPLIESYSKEVDGIIINSLKLLYSELCVISLDKIYSHFNLFDQLNNSRLTLDFTRLNETLKNNCHREAKELGNLKNGYNLNILSKVTPHIDSWKKRLGDIYWEEVIKFKEKVSKKTQERVYLILEDRIVLARNTLEEGIKFYNNLLEKQAQYQEETAEEQLAEKAWINQQRQALETIQMKLKDIIS